MAPDDTLPFLTSLIVHHPRFIVGDRSIDSWTGVALKRGAGAGTGAGAGSGAGNPEDLLAALEEAQALADSR